jgi:hypothetical protein
MDARENCATFPTDQLGKVFIMFVFGTSRCMVCNRLFTHAAFWALSAMANTGSHDMCR